MNHPDATNVTRPHEEPLARFWRELERIPGQAAVETEWRHRIGDDFDRIRDLLHPDPERAACFPRFDRTGSAYHIVEHDDGEIVGISPDDGDRIVLRPSDLIVYRILVPALLRKIAAVFGIQAIAEPVSGLDQVWQLGVDRSRAGAGHPVFFILATEPADYRFRVAALAASIANPFLLVAATNHFHRFEPSRFLDARESSFLALADAIEFTPQGWCLTELARDGLATLRKRHGKQFSSRVDKPRFPMPPGTGWCDVRIRFLDGESLTIFVGDVEKKANYSEMGFNDGRNGKPNKQWKLLRVLARGQGVLSWKSSESDKRNQKRRELLARTLKAYFGLSDDPIELTADGKAWRTRFTLQNDDR